MNNARPVLITEYANWLEEPLSGHTIELIENVIGEKDTTAMVTDVAQLAGISHMPVMKYFYRRGWMQVADGKPQQYSTWVKAEPQELARRVLLPRTGRTRVVARETTQTERVTKHQEIEVSQENTADASWEIDTVGREHLTIAQLQESLAIAGLAVEIRVRRI